MFEGKDQRSENTAETLSGVEKNCCSKYRKNQGMFHDICYYVWTYLKTLGYCILGSLKNILISNSKDVSSENKGTVLWSETYNTFQCIHILKFAIAGRLACIALPSLPWYVVVVVVIYLEPPQASCEGALTVLLKTQSPHLTAPSHTTTGNALIALLPLLIIQGQVFFQLKQALAQMGLWQ